MSHFKSLVLKQVLPVKEIKGNYILIVTEVIVIIFIYLFSRQVIAQQYRTFAIAHLDVHN